MSVFISYSTDGLALVEKISSAVRHLVDVKYWQQDKEPGADAWTSIFEWIDDADVVLVLITDRTLARAMSVGQEVGYAKSQGKTIIPLIATGVPAAELGCLHGVTYVSLDPLDPSPAIDAALAAVKKQFVNAMIISALVGLVAGILIGAGYLYIKKAK